MEQQHESDLVKRLEQLGIEVDVSPTVTTLTYEQIYTSGPTLGRGSQVCRNSSQNQHLLREREQHAAR